MKTILLSLLAVLLLGSIAGAKPRVHKRDRYVLKKRVITRVDVDYKDEDWDVWLWDNKERRIIWKRRLDEKPVVTWSKDRRALAVECLINRFHVLVWREGFRLRDFGAPVHADYPMGCEWSPDNRRLLVRFGRSGASDVDVGNLYCLRLSHWPHYEYFKIGYARKWAWKSRKTAIFWEVEENDYSKLKKLKLWHAP